MFDRYNFNNFLLISFVLVFALGSNFNRANEGLDIYFGKPLLAINAFLIGTYGIFVENEIQNSSLQVQSLIIACVTEYFLVSAFFDLFGYVYYRFFIHIYLGLAAVTALISRWWFDGIERFFRFSFAFSVGFYFIRDIPHVSTYASVISLVLGLGAVFANFLTFKRISIISSVLIFSLMIQHGFDNLSRQLFPNYFEDGNTPYSFYLTLKIIQNFIFIKASIFQLKNANRRGDHLPLGGHSYSTFDN
jgi:hypothetical protein